MTIETKQVRMNIYLDDSELKRRIRIAAANEGVTLSTYCVQAIEQRLTREQDRIGTSTARSPQAAAAALDRLRKKVGPIGIPVRDLIAEGRRE